MTMKTQNLSHYVKKNTNLFFWLLLLAVFVLEGLVIKRSVDIVQNSNMLVGGVPTSRGVRVDFETYHGILSRLEQNRSFRPSSSFVPNPFQSVED